MSKIKECFVRPSASLDLLSHKEIQAVSHSNDDVFKIFRDCALAVLNTGNDTDDADALLKAYENFSVRILPESRGIKLQINNPPSSAFVDGKMIRGIQEHLFSALRDIIFTQDKIDRAGGFDVSSGPGITDAIFRILRNAGVVRANTPPNLVVCWGGHSISREEYDYSKEVGYQMGLRGLDIVTGCGIGAMKGPMKGAMIGHAKQKNRSGRYVGISEPGIIASESPNPTVNELVILPDIEKRLEAFVRLGHNFVVFPGGAGTMEEILYLLGLVMHEENQEIPMPLIFAAPAASSHYFETLDIFIRNTLGDEAAKYYEIIIDRPDQVAQLSLRNLNKMLVHRRRVDESYAFNWNLTIPESMQNPFDPTHEAMAKLNLDRALPSGELIAQLRCAFSGIVAGNVKAEGIRRIAEHGPFQLHADPKLIGALDTMLEEFVSNGRMKISSGDYQPCYRLVADTD
ncbi:MAG: putative Rossmann-fold nucleotide-binding protein [Granulosicoccus sp.]|jgi:predicted Rossmann-fold nucleotide-binding protein